MRNKRWAVLAGAAVAVLATTATPASADGGGHPAGAADRRCARDFDVAQRTDMVSFRDYDLATWKAGHDDDAITVFASAQWIQGRDAIAAALHRHFEDREATWSWTELTRAVDGCTTATILYDATYIVPSRNLHVHELVSVTYTRKHGRWLSVIDQGTALAS